MLDRKLLQALLGVLILVSGILVAAISALAVERSPSPEGAQVYFIAPANGALVTSPFTVRFGLRKMGVAPAGVERDGTGHHHLLINLDAVPNLETPLPANESLKHFGKGQTETELNLEPGTHSLQLLMGNFVHIPHDQPVMSEKITITVR